MYVRTHYISRVSITEHNVQTELVKVIVMYNGLYMMYVLYSTLYRLCVFCFVFSTHFCFLCGVLHDKFRCK